MSFSLKIANNPPPIDEVDKFAKILYTVFNEGTDPDRKFKGIFTKPYTNFYDYENDQEIQKPQYYCDEVFQLENKEQILQSFGWREWGVKAQKILACIEKNK
jgi:hypothetical protein